MKNKRAFTLAEVLITLAIIGIIAAITIPSIVANHQKRALETQFAKAYRTVSQAVNLAIAEHGGIDTWDWKDSYTSAEKDQFVKKYITPHLNIVKYCPTGDGNKDCFPEAMYRLFDGTDWRTLTTLVHPQFVLADGTMAYVAFFENCLERNGRCVSIAIDINGGQKPNVIGKDVFEFNFYSQTGQVLPNGIYKDRTYQNETGKYTMLTEEEINSDTTGWYRAAKVVQDGFKINY